MLFEEFNKETREELLGRLNNSPEYQYAEPYITLGALRGAAWPYLYNIKPTSGREVKKILENKQEREKVLRYILPLLKKGELIMLIHIYDKNSPSKLIETRLSSPKTAKDDIDILRKEWGKFPDDPHGTEETTWFVLPKNKKILQDYCKKNTTSQ